MKEIVEVMSTSIGVFIFSVIIIYVFFNIALTIWLADIKGYNIGIWFVISLLCGSLSLLAIGFAPNRTISEDITIIDKENSNLQKTTKS